MGAELIGIEVAAALPDRQVLVSLQVPRGTTLAEAVTLAGLEQQLPGLAIDEQRLGIFGRIRPADTELRDGDRVEVYRPLKADPKEIRRELAELERKGKR